MTIEGKADPRFKAVRQAFEENLASGDDHGAGLAVVIDGDVVINLTGGYQDRAKALPFTQDTLTCVFSSGKAIVAALIMDAVDKGLVDYDQTVASVWPEFAAEGKDQITLAQAMSHQAGLCGFTEPQEPSIWLDWEATTSALAAMKPLWEPGSASGYHPQTYGFIVGEILRRVTGDTVGKHLRGLTNNVICGLSLSQATRVTPMIKPKSPPDLGPITPLKKAAFLEPWSSPAGVSKQAWAAAEIPASNMHATALALAEIMQLFAAGKIGDKIAVSDEVRSRAWQERIAGDDLVLPFHLSWGAGVIRENGGIYGAPPTTIGHYGFGGSCVLADPARGLSFAYVPNRQLPSLVADPRAMKFISVLYEALT